MKRAPLLLAATSLMGACATTAVGETIPPFTQRLNADNQPLLSYELESRFAGLVGQCIQRTPPLRMRRGSRGDDDNPVSSIDYELITARVFGLLSEAPPTIRQIEPVSVGRLFSYVYPDAEREQQPPRFAQQLMLQLVEADLDKIMPPGFGEARYEASCGSVIEGALRANTGYSFGVATVQAALNSEYRQQSRTVFQIARGRFTSPIWNMWEGADSNSPIRDRQRMYAAMLLWDWYRQERPANHHILTWFEGTSVHQERRRGGASSIGGSVEARLSLPFVSADGSVRGRMSQESDLVIVQPEVFVDTAPSGGETMHFEPIPTPQRIAEVIGLLNSIAEITERGDAQVQPGQARYFRAEVDGLPVAYCSTNWEVRDNRSAAAASRLLSLEEATRIAEGDRRLCQFRIRYSPAANSTGTVSLVPHLVSAPASGTQDRVWIRLGEVSYTSQPPPTLIHRSSTGPTLPPAVIGNAPIPLAWSVNLRMADQGRFRDVDRIDSTGATLECPVGTISGTEPVFDHRFSGSGSSSAITLILDGTAQYEGQLNLTAVDYEQCHLAGKLRFTPVSGGTPIDVDVPRVVLAYPRPRVAPTRTFLGQ